MHGRPLGLTRLSLFVVVVVLESVLLHQFVAPSSGKILDHHFCYQRLKRGLWSPAKLFLRFARVANQSFDFGGTEVARINLYQALSGADVITLFVDALALPSQINADR